MRSRSAIGKNAADAEEDEGSDLQPGEVMESVRVGFFSPGWPGGAFPNGIVSYLGNLVPALAGAGIEATVLAGEVAGSFSDTSVVDVRRFAGKSLVRRIVERVLYARDPTEGWLRSSGRAVARAAASRSLEVIEMEESWGFAREVQRQLGIPVVVRLHGPWFLNGHILGEPEGDDFRRRDAEERRAVAEARIVTSPSHDVLRRSREHYDLPLEEAVVIPYPGSLIPPERRWRADKCNANRILFVGRFDRHKGGDSVISAFARIAAENPDAELVFVGPDRGFHDDLGRKWQIQDYIENMLPIDSHRRRLRWLGQQPAGAIEELRRSAAVTVVASRYETFGMVVMEALSFGCPLVATDVGGIPEIVDRDRTGLLVPPGNADALATAVLSLLRDRDRATALADAGRMAVVRRFAPAEIARVSANLYRRVRP